MKTSCIPWDCATLLSWCTGVKSREANAPPTTRAVVIGMGSSGSASPTFTSLNATVLGILIAGAAALETAAFGFAGFALVAAAFFGAGFLAAGFFAAAFFGAGFFGAGFFAAAFFGAAFFAAAFFAAAFLGFAMGISPFECPPGYAAGWKSGSFISSSTASIFVCTFMPIFTFAGSMPTMLDTRRVPSSRSTTAAISG